MQDETRNLKRSRVESLDVLRGLAVAGMIVVNNPGDWTAVYPPLMHAYWTGLTVADLVFPGFVFTMGAAVPFAFARRRAAGASIADLHRHIGARVVVLVALGLVLNAVSASPQISPLRIPGVLQRLALAYLVTAIVVLHVRQARWLVVAAVLSVGHWALLTLVPFGGHAAGTISPDANLARFIDTHVFGRHALAIPIDPEGLLGTLTAAASAILGAATGELMRRQPADAIRARALAAGGAVALAAGWLWSLVLPLSKPLWTGSFVLATAGIATLVLAAIYFAVDVRGLRRWCLPLAWLGANALVVYAGSEVARRLLDTPKAWLFWEVLQPIFREPLEVASLIFAAAVLAVWIVVARVLADLKVRTTGWPRVKRPRQNRPVGRR
jgi:predicted acyltransferase